MKYSNAISVRDSIRNEKEKQKDILDEMTECYEQQKMSILNYNNIVNYNEHEAIKLRHRYEECVKERNTRGIDLIKRSEEVCVICERANTQESIIKQGYLEMGAREEEGRFLAVRLKEEERVVGLLKKQVPDEEAMRNELDVLRKQVFSVFLLYGR